jgi:transposase
MVKGQRGRRMAQGRRPGLRVATAVRTQIAIEMICLDDLLPPGHRARQVWGYVETCDLSPLYEVIRAVVGEAGRPPIDPAILMALWLYATLEGVGSARLLERSCKSDLAYRWICGGVGVNYHTLADFRITCGAVLDGLLTRSMAALAAAGVVELDCLAVDGVRVRAAAGASSFRRRPRLLALHDLAEQKVATLRAELERDPAAAAGRAQARRLREAEAREARLKAAVEAAEEIARERQREAERQRRRQPRAGRSEPRASTTDSEARIMKMADGGFRPADNAQFTTDPKSGCILAVAVTNCSSDRGQLTPAVDGVAERYGRVPRRVLADGGYDGKDDIDALYERSIEVFCPIPGSHDKPVPVAAKRSEGPGVLAWRERMSLEENYGIYRQRFSCERPHADMRNRGLQRLLVCGLAKAKSVILWYAYAYNFLQIRRLAPRRA